MSILNRQWRIRRKPDAEISKEHFDWVEEEIPQPAAGELLVRTIYLSIDPVQRYWLSKNPTFGPPTEIGQVMPGRIWGVVEESRSPKFDRGANPLMKKRLLELAGLVTVLVAVSVLLELAAVSATGQQDPQRSEPVAATPP